ncbi:MAG: fructosamine kinase family protein [Pseudomonadota bacterium]
MAVFRKTAAEYLLEQFEAEAEGLAAIQATGTIRVPEVYAVGVKDGQAYIEMERLVLTSSNDAIDAQFGEALAEMHRSTGDAFGWSADNFCGPTPQPNHSSADWTDFFAERRLGYQLNLATANGYRFEGATRVRDHLDRLLADHEPAMSLIHGDLWSGNWGVVDGAPVVFDPAIHYADRECDLAMSRLFGGFGHDFYAAYEKAWPLAPGSAQRQMLYQLYHVLNHVNLFGGGYAGQAQSLLRKLARVV